LRADLKRAPAGEDWVEKVRAASDIVEVVQQTVTLRRAGRNWVGLCPFHSEKTGSFSVSAERQLYHCFSCKVGGDVFKFVMETEKVGFLEAVELLSRRAGIPVPERGAGPRGQRTGLVEALEAAAAAYEQWLGDPATGATARAYLESRGVTRETIRAFRVGVSPAGWTSLVSKLAQRADEALLVSAGLAMRRETGGLYDRFRNRLMIPLVASGGTVVGFGARALQPGDEPKYLNSPETPLYHKGAFLFGFDEARRHVEKDGEVIVVEGYFDAMALHQAGVRNVVATSGTALTADHAKLLRRLAGRVALTFDGDAAGREAGLRSLSIVLAEPLDVVVVELPAGEDPDALVRRGGRAAWDEVRSRAVDVVEFVSRQGRGGPGASDPREAAVQALVGILAGVKDPVRTALLIDRAEQVLGVREAILRRAIDLRRSGFRSEEPVRAAVRSERRVADAVEHQLLRALIQDPEILAEAREWVAPGDFLDPVASKVAEWLWSGSGEALEGPEAELVRELSLRTEEEYKWRDEARGAARNLQIRRLKRERRSLEERLRSDPTGSEARQIQESIYQIARSLRELTS